MDLNSKGRTLDLVPELEYNRIGIVQLEETDNDHPVQLPWGSLKLQHVAKGSMPLAFVAQMLLKHWQAGVLASSLGSLFLGYNTLLVNKCFLMSGLNLHFLSFEPFLWLPSLDSRQRRSTPLVSTSPPQEALESHEVTPQPPSLQTDKLQILNCSSQELPSSPFTSFSSLELIFL